VSTAPPLRKPDGTPYINSHDDWNWMEGVANRARWLGYIRFDDIVDERNAPPQSYDFTVEPFITIEDRSFLASAVGFDSMLPSVKVEGFEARQAYRLVLIGEKTSLADVLRPLAVKYRGELVLPTGDLSTTQLHGIAARANEDGRPCRIFYFR
jgi:hypothetical protein